jgi:hypothetical protein
MMDAKTYCDNVQAEVSLFKEKIYEVIQELDKIPALEREKVSPQIGEFHVIVDVLTDRLETLARECPIEYGSEKQDIEEKMSELKTKMQDMYDGLSSLFGG